MLKNKIIIVAGGSGLLGREIVKQVQEQGGTAVNLDVHAATDTGNHTITCDITSPASVDAAFELAEKTYGPVDGLVNSAYPRTKDWGKKLEAVTYESWQQNVDMQLNSAFYISRLAAEKMKVRKQGSIVFMSSIYGMVGPDFTIYEGTEMTVAAPYAAIKGAILNFARYMAAYYGPHGLRVNCITPGGIFDNQLESFVKAYEKKVPLKRMGLPADIAPAACFLLSDSAAYITGHNLVVDGGWTAI